MLGARLQRRVGVDSATSPSAAICCAPGGASSTASAVAARRASTAATIRAASAAVGGDHVDEIGARHLARGAAGRVRVAERDDDQRQRAHEVGVGAARLGRDHDRTAGATGGVDQLGAPIYSTTPARRGGRAA